MSLERSVVPNRLADRPDLTLPLSVRLAGEATQNRRPSTTKSTVNQPDLMERDGHSKCAPEKESVATLAALGSALPPFSPLGPETLGLLLRLARGGAPAEPIGLTHAIVAQIWLLFFGPES